MSESIEEELPESIVSLSQHDQWVVWGYRNGTKIPINPNSRTYDRASVSDSFTWGSFEDAARAFRTFERLEGLGFVFRSSDPFIGVDLDDCRDPETGDASMEARRIIDRLKTYTEISPTGTGFKLIGVHEDTPVSMRNDEQGIEVYSTNRFFTITGEGLEWVPQRACDITGEIDWLLDEYGAQPDRSSREASGLGPTHINPDYWVEDALGAIDPDLSYDTWVSVGMALHNAYNGAEEGFEIWDAWSQGGDKYEENEDGEMRTKWRSFHTDRQRSRTLRTVWDIASRNGWELEADPEVREASEQLVENHLSEPPLKLYDYANTYEDDSPYEPDLVGPGLIGPGDLAMLFGPPKSEKTLITVSACRQWAMGEPFLWMEPERPLRTIYLNFELKRDAWRQRSHRLDLNEEEIERMRGRFHFTDRMVETLTVEFARKFLDAVESQVDGDVDLLVVDPTVNFFSGEDENDNQEVMSFLEDLRDLVHHIDPDAASLLVHHTSKVEYDDPFSNLRGAGAFRGAYDTGWYVEKDKSNDTIELHTEARNSKEDMPPRTLVRDGETGRYQIEGDGGGSGALRKAGRRAGELWDAEHARKMRTILDVLKEEAEEGRVHTKGSFSSKFGSHRSYQIGSKKTVKRLIGELATKKLVAYYNASDYGGPSVPPNAKGHLCCEGMVLPDPIEQTIDQTEGVVQEVQPEWFEIEGYPDPRHVTRLEDPDFCEMDDYYRDPSTH